VPALAQGDGDSVSGASSNSASPAEEDAIGAASLGDAAGSGAVAAPSGTGTAAAAASAAAAHSGSSSNNSSSSSVVAVVYDNDELLPMPQNLAHRKVLFQMVPADIPGALFRRKAMQQLCNSVFAKAALLRGQARSPVAIMDNDCAPCIHVAYALERPWLTVSWTDHRGQLLEAAALRVSSGARSGECQPRDLDELLAGVVWRRAQAYASTFVDQVSSEPCRRVCVTALNRPGASELLAWKALMGKPFQHASGVAVDHFALCHARAGTVACPPRSPAAFRVVSAGAGSGSGSGVGGSSSTSTSTSTSAGARPSRLVVGCQRLRSDPSLLPVLEVELLAGGTALDDVVRDMQLLGALPTNAPSSVVPAHIQAVARLALWVGELSFS
jgi:hypothetical protein